MPGARPLSKDVTSGGRLSTLEGRPSFGIGKERETPLAR
jgi:hypothetical protein